MKSLNSIKNVGILSLAGFIVLIIAVCYFGNKLSKLEYATSADGKKMTPIATSSTSTNTFLGR